MVPRVDAGACSPGRHRHTGRAVGSSPSSESARALSLLSLPDGCHGTAAVGRPERARRRVAATAGLGIRAQRHDASRCTSVRCTARCCWCAVPTIRVHRGSLSASLSLSLSVSLSLSQAFSFSLSLSLSLSESPSYSLSRTHSLSGPRSESSEARMLGEQARRIRVARTRTQAQSAMTAAQCRVTAWPDSPTQVRIRVAASFCGCGQHGAGRLPAPP